MIDTKTYEGHTEGSWTLEEREDDEGHQWFEVPAVSYTTKLSGDGSQQEFADAKLIADAPLLLAEVKRLSALADALFDLIPSHLSTEATDIWNEHMGDEEE